MSDAEHLKHAAVDGGENEPDLFAAAVDLVVHDLAHAVRIDVGNPGLAGSARSGSGASPSVRTGFYALASASSTVSAMEIMVLTLVILNSSRTRSLTPTTTRRLPLPVQWV